MKKRYWVMLVVLILIIVVILAVIFFEPFENGLEWEGRAPANIEATIVSLELDDLVSEGGCGRLLGVGYYEAGNICPRDVAVIRVDNLDKGEIPDSLIDFDLGDELVIAFTYSARPAKLRKDTPPSCADGWVSKNGDCVLESCERSNCMVSSPIYETEPTEIEGDYLVYHLPARGDLSEEILLGLEEGSKIKLEINEGDLMAKDPFDRIEVDRYEII